LSGVADWALVWERIKMIEWGLLAKIAGGGFGVTILVLIILSLVAWVVGLIVQRTAKQPEKNSSKG
jgi:Na+-transporting methylmalonyl-CoA/oxaloacetate decarboxylase gamma subunit